MSSSRAARLELAARLAVVARLTTEVRLQQVAYDRFHDAVAAYLGINRTDLRCLDLLDLHGGRMSAGDLAASMGLSTGAVTAMLDRLEKIGYVRRVRDPDDRRRVLVETGDAARERGLEIYQPFQDATLPMLDGYTDEQIALVAGFLHVGNEFYATQTARVEAMKRSK
jgi:DNA-binding MarR family transcriptional regulator